MTTAPTVGFLHPGAMGSTIAATATGARKLWAGDGRSSESRARAGAAELEDVGTVAAMAETADVIVSVCPPGAALDQAGAVAAAGFTGVYVDANAVSPDTARRIGTHFDRFVDGGIVGPPAVHAGTTRLYLSGPEATAVAELWSGSALEVRVVDGGAGAASAVKMAFAAWTKGTSALLLAINALAEAEGVRADLVGEWQTSMPDLIARSNHTPAGVGPKAWRFGPEMEEIAATFAAAGLPSGFHEAAAETYRRLASFKTADPAPDLDAVIAALLAND
jgi:3-hydroxyisobutyrate dehydrogenase-like beta-hydroxyacid dehydrogenase